MESPTVSIPHILNQSVDEFNDHSSSNMCPPLRVTPLIITAGLVSTGIIVGNCLVIIAIVGGGSKLFRPMYWFIIHLSCTDLLVGFMLLWHYCLAAVLDINNTMTSLFVLQALWVTGACSSVLGILLLAVDRYMQVVHRRLHGIYFNQKTVGVAILFAWIIPMLLFLVIPIVSNWSCKHNCRCHDNSYMECWPSDECSQVIPPFKKSFTLFCLLYLFLIMPWPILIYSLIFIRARKSTQALHQRMRHRDMRLIRTLIAIMLAFIITLTPSGVIMAVDYATSGHSSELIDYALYMFLVGASNSLLNPILYIWRIPAIRVSLERRFGCCQKSMLNQHSRTSKNGHRTLHFNSEPMMHSDPPDALHSPLARKPGAHHSCGGNISFNFSDVSQNSTPVSQRSVKMPVRISKKKRAKMFEMQKLASNIPNQSLSRSPLCSDSKVPGAANKQSKLLDKVPCSNNELSPTPCCVTYSSLRHSPEKDYDEAAALSTAS